MTYTTGFNMTEAAEILKRDYLPVVREQIPTKTPLFNLINKGTEDVVGSEARLSLRTNRNQGVGARADGGALPTAGHNQYKQIGVTVKNLYGRLALPGKLFRAARSNRGAFINAVDAELKGMVEALQWDLNRQLFGDGTGKLATVDAATGTSLTVNGSDASYKTRWLAQKMKVDVYNAAKDTKRNSGGVLTITSVDKSADTVTFDTSVTTSAATDFIVREGSLDQEITGLRAVMDTDNTLYGINRSTAGYEWFRPQHLSNSGTNRMISEVLLQEAIDEAEINAGGSINLMISDHGVRRSYQDLMVALKRYTEPKRLVGGYTSLDYNGINWVADPDCRANTIYLLDMSTFKIHTMIGDLFDWGEEDNQILRQVAGYDAYEAFMVAYMELVCDTPAKNCLLEDITE